MLNTQNLYNLLIETDRECHNHVKALSKISNDDYVYIERHKDNKILLVAHTDTVRTSSDYPIDLAIDGNKNHLINRNGVLGADDRTGVFLILELLRNRVRGFDVLFLSGEEKGGIGIKSFCSNMPDGFIDHYNLYIELDRQGQFEFVQYGDENSEVLDYFQETLKTPLTCSVGSYSDVYDLSETTGIDHINLAVGYVNQHTTREYQDLNYLDIVYNFLKQLVANPPAKAFIYQPCDFTYGYKNSYDQYYMDDDEEECLELLEESLYYLEELLHSSQQFNPDLLDVIERVNEHLKTYRG